MDKTIEILMIGPGASKTSSGGIVSVIDSIVDVLSHKFFIKRIITMKPDTGIINRIMVYTRSYITICSILMNRNRKIAHIHLASKTSFYRKSLLIIFLKLFRIPVIIHLHGGEFHLFYSKQSNGLIQKYIRWIFGLADKVFLLTNSWKLWYESTMYRDNAMVVYNGTKSYYNPRSMNIEDRNNIILFLGKLGKNKGIYDLLKAFKYILITFPQAILKVGGNGDIEGCKNLVKELDIEKSVEFLGWVEEDQKYILFNEAKVYVLPSYNEGLPMGLLEAMSAGIATISSKVGGIPEIIENEKIGMLIDAGDINAIKENILNLLKDKDKLIAIGRQGKESFEKKYHIDITVQKIIKAYNELSK